MIGELGYCSCTKYFICKDTTSTMIPCHMPSCSKKVSSLHHVLCSLRRLLQEAMFPLQFLIQSTELFNLIPCLLYSSIPSPDFLRSDLIRVFNRLWDLVFATFTQPSPILRHWDRCLKREIEPNRWSHLVLLCLKCLCLGWFGCRVGRHRLIDHRQEALELCKSRFFLVPPFGTYIQIY